MGYKMTQDRVLIKEIPAGKTAAGLELPEKMKDTAPVGMVLETGPMVKDIKKGFKVCFDPRMALEIYIGGQNLLITRESDVMFTITDGHDLLPHNN